jgi:hypothetical protein
LFLNTSYLIQAQELKPASLNNSGSTYKTDSNSLSYVLGDLVTGSFQKEDVSLTSGFTNITTNIIEVISVDELKPEILTLRIYPNPSSELINIQIIKSRLESVFIEIIDLRNSLLFSGYYNMFNSTIKINISEYDLGVYILNVKDNSQNVIGVYKVIKL